MTLPNSYPPIAAEPADAMDRQPADAHTVCMNNHPHEIVPVGTQKFFWEKCDYSAVAGRLINVSLC